jgi:hypothetical protein
MTRGGRIVVSALAVAALVWLGIALGGWSPLTVLGVVLNSVRGAANPAGTLTVEYGSFGERQLAELQPHAHL